jgi:pimeloyl-ACP methyl ester carboxylesterase
MNPPRPTHANHARFRSIGPGLAASWRPRTILGACLLSLLSVAATAPAQNVEPFLGHWEGSISVPTGELLIKVDLMREGDHLAGTIDIPTQGAAGLPLDKFQVDGERVTFVIKGVPGDPTFSGKLANGEISGDFYQGGGRFPFTHGRGEVAPPKRPQDPTPPYPYDERDVTYSNGDITLAGTLTLPKGGGKHASALLITGSGAQDRDEALLGHRPFLVIADHLTRAGIAVLRVDDRGVGGSTGNHPESTTADLAGDVLAGVRFLAKQPGIDSAKIGLIGHSEGGIIGPLAASQSKDVAYLVLLAGTGVPGSQVLPRQLERMAKADGVPQEQIDQQLELQQKLLALLASDKSTDEIEPPFREVVAAQVDMAGGASEDQREQVIEQAVTQTLNPWFRFFVKYDPRPALEKVSVPVLALNGSLDTQVDAEQNLPEIEKALTRGGNTDFKVKVLPGLNHLFQHATTGTLAEYAAIEETFDPVTLQLISEWILERFG